MFKSFIYTLSQLRNENRTSIIIDENEVIIELSENRKSWVISKIIYTGFEMPIPKSIRQCLLACGIMYGQNALPYLKMQEHQVTMVQEIKAPDNFTSFRLILRNFINLSKEWNAILDELTPKNALQFKKNHALFSF